MLHLAHRGCRLCLTKNIARIDQLQTRRYGAAAAVSTIQKYDYLSTTTEHAPTHPYPPPINHPVHRMPPGHQAVVTKLKTFFLPDIVRGTSSDIELGKQMIASWRKDGIFQIAMNPKQQNAFDKAFLVSKAYFALPHAEKSQHVDSQSFAGYVASGEELTDGTADYSEIFTVAKDFPDSDPRVRARWPCHGPCPWPNKGYERVMKSMMHYLGESGDTLLKLAALGLGLKDANFFSDLTDDGWHHMRVLRFPQVDRVNGKGKAGRGIGSHTDYGLLVIAGQDEIGGLFIRPPTLGEDVKNWKKSAAGLNEDDDKWHYIAPADGVLTVFPGDMMQYLTSSYLPATPHKVGLNVHERFAFAYFHEPNFCAKIKPLPEFLSSAQTADDVGDKGIHYGRHFTNMCMRNYPERATAKRMLREGRMEILAALECS